MPTYEYECTACGQHIEVFQRFSEDPLTTCGNCEGALRKVFHPAGIVFKGSGFYATDSRSKKPSTSGTKKDGDATSSAKGDTSTGPSSGGASSSEGGSSGERGSSGDGGSSGKASAAKDQTS
jgi:putative FmdB family regulatory protein